MRLGIVGDIHAEDELLDRVLTFFRGRVDRVLFVGDVVDGPGNLEAVIRHLRHANAVGVRGNHERWMLADSARDLPNAHLANDLSPSAGQFLAQLPPTRTITTPIGKLLLCHGMDDNDMNGLHSWDEGYGLENFEEVQRILRARDYSMVVAGHTHERMLRTLNGVVFINAGTLAPPDPCAVVLDCDIRQATFLDARIPSRTLERIVF